MTIAVLGSINIDLVAYSQKLPRPGETLQGDRYAIGLGGKGCNQAVAASKLGAQTTMLGKIGKDNFAQTVLSELARFRIPTHCIEEDPDVGTGIAVIGVDKDAQNSITVIGGANMTISSENIVHWGKMLEQATCLMLQLETPLEASIDAAKIVKSSGGLVILDPAPARALPDHVLALVDVITPNETETETLTGILPETRDDARKAALTLRDKGVRTAIIKMGAQGVYYMNKEEEGFIPAFKVQSIDTVAAGDCFNGALAYSLTQGNALPKAVRFAAAAGALATTRQGAADAAPELREVLDLMDQG